MKKIVIIYSSLMMLFFAFSSWGYAAQRGMVRVAGDAQGMAERRVALIIGNASYENAGLMNPVNDARAVAASLQNLDFEVLHYENADKNTMATAIRQFGNKLKGKGGVGLFYFAGHGMQVAGQNYLIPVGHDIRKEYAIKVGAVNANFILDEMKLADNRVNIMILDACRNNPFARRFRSARSGLAELKSSTGTLIAFATAPGSVASDGAGTNSVYTQHLLANLSQPDWPIERVFKAVRRGVIKDTRGEQIPWENSSLVDEFYFQSSSTTPGSHAVISAVTQAAQEPPELVLWKQAMEAKNPALYQVYLQQHPQGTYAELARQLLRTQQVAVTQPDYQQSATVVPQPAYPQASAAVLQPEVTGPQTVPATALVYPQLPTQQQAPVNPNPALPGDNNQSYELYSLLAQARAAYERNDLTTPETDSAVRWAEQVLYLDAQNAEARQILAQVVGKYLSWSRSNVKRGRTAKATKYLGIARNLQRYAVQTQVHEMDRLSGDIRRRVAAAKNYRKHKPRNRTVHRNANTTNNNNNTYNNANSSPDTNKTAGQAVGEAAAAAIIIGIGAKLLNQ